MDCTLEGDILLIIVIIETVPAYDHHFWTCSLSLLAYCSEEEEEKKESCKLKVRLESNGRLVAFKQIKDQLNDFFYYYYYFLTLELKYLSEKKGRGSLNKKKKRYIFR
jgi:hypothetical protein